MKPLIQVIAVCLLGLSATMLIGCGGGVMPTIVRETVQVPVPQTVLVPVLQTVPVTVKETVPIPAVITATPAPTPAPKRGGTLIAARVEDTKGLDPHKQVTYASFRMLELIYDPLLAFDKDLKIVPNLAEAWKWSEDSKTLTVTLRKNVKFHNGDPMTSDDVKFSFERILDDKTSAAARSSFTSIDKINAPDPNTIVFTLKAPNASLLSAMANPNSAIINKKQVTGGADPAKVDVGSGAFMIDKWDPDRTFTMKAFKDFWIPGLPRIDAIEWRTLPGESLILAGLRAKTLDWALITDPRVAIRASAGISTLNIYRAPDLTSFVLQLNAKRAVFFNVKVRQAIACAIDRQEVIDTALLGEGQMTSPATALPYRVNSSDLMCYTKDETKVKQALADAGKSTGFKFRILVGLDELPTALSTAQNLQAQLKKVNIDTDIESVEATLFVDRWTKGDFDAAVLPIGGNPDPDVALYRYWHSTGGLNNIAGYNSPDLDKLLEQGRITNDFEKRKSIYSDIQKKLADAAPWVWLYSGYEYRVGQSFVKDFTPLANGSLIYLREAWLDK